MGVRGTQEGGPPVRTGPTPDIKDTAVSAGVKPRAQQQRVRSYAMRYLALVDYKVSEPKHGRVAGGTSAPRGDSGGAGWGRGGRGTGLNATCTGPGRPRRPGSPGGKHHYPASAHWAVHLELGAGQVEYKVEVQPWGIIYLHTYTRRGRWALPRVQGP